MKDWYPNVKDRSALFRRLKEWAKIYEVTRREMPEGSSNNYKGVEIPFIIDKERWEVPDELIKTPVERFMQMLETEGRDPNWETPGTDAHGFPVRMPRERDLQGRRRESNAMVDEGDLLPLLGDFNGENYD